MSYPYYNVGVYTTNAYWYSNVFIFITLGYMWEGVG